MWQVLGEALREWAKEQGPLLAARVLKDWLQHDEPVSQDLGGYDRAYQSFKQLLDNNTASRPQAPKQHAPTDLL